MKPPRGFGGDFRTDLEACAVYSEAAGIHRLVPSAVAVPRSVADVSMLVRWARDERLSLVPRGSGSSMAGGAVGRGVVVDLSGLRQLEWVGGDQPALRCGPGVLRKEIEEAARSRGLRFPVDPSSGSFCTIGGMTATNAAGAHSLAYGPTRAWVTAVECVFDDGSCATFRRGEPPPSELAASARFARDVARSIGMIRTGSLRHHVRKESSGYGLADFAESGDLVDVIVGSEGTLAMIVGVEVRLAPAAGASVSLLAGFDHLDAAVAGAAAARELGASVCELLDRTFLDVAETGGKLPALPRGTEAVLLSEVEGRDPAEADGKANALTAEMKRSGATHIAPAALPEETRELWELRHAASPILSRLEPSLKSMQVIEDAAVPTDRFGDYVRGVKAALDRAWVRGVIFGHAGDAHVHVNPLVDVSRKDWRERVTRLVTEVTSLVADLGGTATGEHGDGRLRASLLPRLWQTEAVAAFRAVKTAFDPDRVFNPGCKIAEPGWNPMDDVKYDPALPKLPDSVRSVLDRVAGEKGYAKPRLSLLDQRK